MEYNYTKTRVYIWLFRVYVGDEKTTQLFRDYFINHGNKDPGTLNNQYNGGFYDSQKPIRIPIILGGSSQLVTS